jgi:hypothetical protein
MFQLGQLHSTLFHMNNLTFLMVFLLLNALISPVCSLYFSLREGPINSQCFIEDVPEDFLMLAQYKIVDWDQIVAHPNAKTGIELMAIDKDGNVVYSTTASGAKGYFAFTSTQAGEYRVCFTNKLEGINAIKVELTFSVNEDAEDYTELAKVQHLTGLQIDLRKVQDKLKTVKSIHDYLTKREFVFRNISEQTNSRVLWWSLAQTALLVAAGVYQFFMLKRLFKSKKIA